MSIKRLEQTPNSNVSIHRKPGFCAFVWPSRARLPLGTALLMARYVDLSGTDFAHHAGRARLIPGSVAAATSPSVHARR
jgi:hypothetical protein